jgi:hypothetical protein
VNFEFDVCEIVRADTALVPIRSGRSDDDPSSRDLPDSQSSDSVRRSILSIQNYFEKDNTFQVLDMLHVIRNLKIQFQYDRTLLLHSMSRTVFSLTTAA